MARGRKPLPKNYNKLIEEVDEKIARYKKRIEEFEQERADLVEAQKKEEMENLYKQLSSTGKSVDEIISLVQSAPNKTIKK